VEYGTLGEKLAQMNQHYFVGRSEEMHAFEAILNGTVEACILNVYGSGGIGKSTLLEAYQRTADRYGIPFLRLDSMDFLHTPDGLCGKLLSVCGEPVPSDEADLLGLCVACVNRIASSGGAVLAIDAYEKLDSLDWWFRKQFLPLLNRRVKIVFSGRYPLNKDWHSSPAWRSMILELPLGNFTMEETVTYANRWNLHDVELITRIYRMTRGYPLSLSLYIGSNLSKSDDAPPCDQLKTFLNHLVSRWFSEVPDDRLKSLVEIASFVRSFNQETLEFLSGKPLTCDDFERLISLSFIRPNQCGWHIHECFREPIQLVFKASRPALFHQTRQRSIDYVVNALRHCASETDKSLYFLDLYSVIGLFFISEMFSEDDEAENRYSLEPVGTDALHEAIRYISEPDPDETAAPLEFYDFENQKKISIEYPNHYHRTTYTYLDVKTISQFSHDSIMLLKDCHGRSVGIIVLIPIHDQSLEFLASAPISKHYFKKLSFAARSWYNVPPSKASCYFLYHFDIRKDGSAAAKSVIYRKILERMSQSKEFIFSTPLQGLHEILLDLGFAKVPGTVHYDFGRHAPAPIFTFNGEPDTIRQILNRMKSREPSVPWFESGTDECAARDAISVLTAREQEIAAEVLLCKTNAEIARALHISEVTVKKHIEKIASKLDVQGKAEVIRKLADIESKNARV